MEEMGSAHCEEAYRRMIKNIDVDEKISKKEFR